MAFLNACEPPWRISAYYFIFLVLISLSAKTISAAIADLSFKEKFHFLTIAPVLSISAWKRRRAARGVDVQQLLLRIAWVWPTLIAVYMVFPGAVSQPQLSWFLRGYLAILPFWLLTEAIGLAIQLSFVVTGTLTPPIHESPWRSRSLADFWGRRWNRLFSDWLRETCFNPLRRKPILSLMAAFLVSGILHEILVNVPLKVVYGANLMGSMLLYFLLQAGGILIERRWLRRQPRARMCFLWTTVLGPSPLVLNEATLRIFHLAG